MKELSQDVCVPMCVEGYMFECVFMFECMLYVPVSVRFWGQE